LLVAELEKHLPPIVAAQPEDARRALHALKGSAGLAGEQELSVSLERLERRLREGDMSARAEAADLVGAAIERLSRGEPAVVPKWPEPPAWLLATPVDAKNRAQYSAEVQDRLARIDEALQSELDPVSAAGLLYRHVHTIKGAASAVGAEAMAWFCHGLEERLGRGTARDVAMDAVREVARYRHVLGGLLDDPAETLHSLRALAARRRGSIPPPPLPDPARPPRGGHDATTDAAPQSPPREDDATIRVSAAAVDRLLDALETIGLVRERIGARIERTKVEARSLRRARGALSDALRLIGPPRPWGAPAAALMQVEGAATSLGALADELEVASGILQGGDQLLKEAVASSRRDLSAMRITTVGRFFARLVTAIEAEARRAERAVIVQTEGVDETLDRRLAEQLLEPCLQLARNAVAHGLEPPNARAALGKPKAGTVTLSAKKLAHRLVISIRDDGAGVDMDAVRRKAKDARVVAPDVAEVADENTLLALLFVPGFSTRERTDVLAGRGIGLDIVRRAVPRRGGAVRLARRPREGFEARVEVPIETGLARVLWVVVGDAPYAITATNVGVVERLDASLPSKVPHLGACLEPIAPPPAAYAIELCVDELGHGEERVIAGVDALGEIEEVLIRPLSPLLIGLGPFAGAIVRGDGSLRLALDAYALAPRIRALGKAPRGSDTPSSPP
jgi:two-component system chemotaxis sensor kinase CheA